VRHTPRSRVFTRCLSLFVRAPQLKSESFGYARIVKWVVSRDGKIFAFNLEDDRIIYVVTEAAGFIERCVERYVEEMVRYKGGKSEAERWAAPRESSGPGVTGMAAYLSAHARPSPAYAFVPTPAQQAAVATALAGAAASKPADAKAGAAGCGNTGGRAPAGPSAELPPHWRALKDAEGDTFYWNEVGGEGNVRAAGPDPSWELMLPEGARRAWGRWRSVEAIEAEGWQRSLSHHWLWLNCYAGTHAPCGSLPWFSRVLCSSPSRPPGTDPSPWCCHRTGHQPRTPRATSFT